VELITNELFFSDITRGKEENEVQCINNLDDEGEPQDYKYITENCFTSNIIVDRSIASMQVGTWALIRGVPRGVAFLWGFVHKIRHAFRGSEYPVYEMRTLFCCSRASVKTPASGILVDALK